MTLVTYRIISRVLVSIIGAVIIIPFADNDSRRDGDSEMVMCQAVSLPRSPRQVPSAERTQKNVLYMSMQMRVDPSLFVLLTLLSRQCAYIMWYPVLICHIVSHMT